MRSGTQATVPVPDPSRPVYFEVVPRRARHGPVVADRLLALEGSPNTRDLGGYRTYDGHQVRWGRIFRTAGLDALTDGDRARLAAIGLSDKCPTGPTTDDGPVDAAAIRAEAVADITDPAIRKQHGALLRALARDARPRFVSCSLLDDRTGWPVALVLSTLGVPKETVVGDYLQSNQLGGSPAADRTYLDAGYEAVRSKYKTFGRYLVKGLGLDERTYLRLRKRLLD